MQKVISALERQVGIEEGKRMRNVILRESQKIDPLYRESHSFKDDPDYIEQLREAIIVLKNYEREHSGQKDCEHSG